MQFSTLLTAVLATTAAAAPTALSKKAATTINSQEAGLIFALQAADCSVLSCGKVVLAAACIASVIASEGATAEAVIGCVGEGIDSVCDCASCVPGLGDFLTNNNLCPS